MIKVWRADHSKTAPVQVECEVFKYPHKDANGDTIFSNSHFENEEDAWQGIIKEYRAGVSLACMNVRDLRSQLARAEAEVVKYSMLLTETEENHRNRKAALEVSS